jgi:SAM-dependent methyltransferase
MTHERIDPNLDKDVMLLSRLAHIKRYKKAAEILKGSNLVLDAGCGYGYGSNILADVCERVVGVDRSPEAIDYANVNYKNRNMDFQVGDVIESDLSSFGKVDGIIFFEVIEHLSLPSLALTNFRECLKENGYLFISTPNVKNSSKDNLHHSLEYSLESLENLLDVNDFRVVERLGQYPILGSVAGVVGKLTGYQSCTKKDSGLVPKLIDAVPLLPSFFSGLYSSKLALNTARTIYLVAQPK